ncbi:MAG: adenine phosphoribosyltransferase [Planctomycetes bacterium]|nr:adenine phosphoribosyltransferase [Planctomycetota bacterium]MCB9872014.1 adenine phosphoribosyltransferase [Planctomycetota bacterium]MCB9888418.1 adenine phosphoribosyltransferase [Planctomycetota bacterium]
MNLADYLRDVPDFPKPGIVFKDISPLLADPAAFAHAVDRMAELVGGWQVDRIAGIESRGFLFGTPLAMQLGVGFTPLRKPGKLPAETTAVEYGLEYGTDTLEIHTDGVAVDEHVLIVDDVLATGGTAAAACELVEVVGGRVAGCVFLLELGFLAGRAKLADRALASVMRID